LSDLLGVTDWLIGYGQSLVEQAREQIIKLLSSEWLVADVENPEGQWFSSLFLGDDIDEMPSR
jgi:hypothetical protein